MLKTVSGASVGSSGFPITLGNTSITAGSTTTTLSNLTLNNVTINGTTENNISFSNVNVLSGNIANVTIANSTVTNVSITSGTENNVTYSNVTITGGTENNLTYTNVTISSGNVVVTKATAQTIVANGSISASSNVGAFSYGNLTYSDTGIVASYSNAANSTIQVIVQNSSNLANASTDIVVTNDTGIAYADFGINSSTLTGTGKFYTANTAYLYSGSADLYVGTFSSNAIHFVANNSTTDAMVINANNTVTINALNQSTNANATMSTASIPLVPLGYIIVNNNGTNVKIPYYAV